MDSNQVNNVIGELLARAMRDGSVAASGESHTKGCAVLVELHPLRGSRNTIVEIESGDIDGPQGFAIGALQEVCDTAADELPPELLPAIAECGDSTVLVVNCYEGTYYYAMRGADADVMSGILLTLVAYLGVMNVDDHPHLKSALSEKTCFWFSAFTNYLIGKEGALAA